MLIVYILNQRFPTGAPHGGSNSHRRDFWINKNHNTSKLIIFKLINYQKTTYLVPGTTFFYYVYFLLGTKCFQKVFQNIFRLKYKYKYPKKAFLEFFCMISRGHFTGTKCEKVVLFGFITDSKGDVFLV